MFNKPNPYLKLHHNKHLDFKNLTADEIAIIYSSLDTLEQLNHYRDEPDEHQVNVAKQLKNAIQDHRY